MRIRGTGTRRCGTGSGLSSCPWNRNCGQAVQAMEEELWVLDTILVVTFAPPGALTLIPFPLPQPWEPPTTQQKQVFQRFRAASNSQVPSLGPALPLNLAPCRC